MSEQAAFDGVFVDEDILGVAHELARLRPGAVYYVGHQDVPEIPLGTKDPELLAILKSHQRNWIFISKDKRIWRKKAERKQLTNARIRAIFLTGTGTLYKHSAAALINDHWDEIVDSIGNQPGPAVWSLTRPNGLRRIDDDQRSTEKP